MEDVFGLGGYAEVVVDLEAVEEVVETAEPDVAQHDVGGLEDGADPLGVVHGQADGLGAEGVGLAGAETGAVAQDLVVGVVDEVPLGGEEGGVDAVAQRFVGFGAAGAGGLGALEDVATGNPRQNAHAGAADT
jgi:hypothetical protein